MKLDQLRIPLIPRSTHDCLDLGLKFVGAHLWDVLRLWFWVASPCMLLIYFLVHQFDAHLGHALLIVFLVTGPWSVLLIQKAINVSFGGDFADVPESRAELQTLVQLMLKAIGVRILSAIGFLMVIIPGWILAVRLSFFVEKRGLSGLRADSQDRATSKLVKQELSSLLSRSLTIFGMVIIYAFSLFVTFDFLIETLLQVSVFWGRVWGEDSLTYYSEFGFVEEALRLISTDPMVVALLSGILLLMYPVGRLAWYFSYIDMRVRGDFWDLELQFQKEVERLQEVRA